MFRIIFTIGAVQFFAVFIQFIKSKIIAVYLGPAGVGIVGTIDQIVQFIAFFSAFGFPAASVKFLSKAHSEGDDAFRKNYSFFFKFLFLLSAAGAGITIAAILIKPDFLGSEFKQYKLFLILGLMTLPTFTLTALFVNVFAAAQKFRASSLLILIINLVSTVSVVFGVIYAGISGLYINALLAGTFTTIAVVIYFHKKFGLPYYDRQISIRNIFKYNSAISSTALLLYFSAITASLSYLAARYSVLKSFGEFEAGLLHSAMGLSFAFGTALYPAINIYLNPLVNRDLDKSIKMQQIVSFQRKLTIMLSLAAIPILMFPKLVLTLLFSEKFVSVSQFVYLFIISQFIIQLAAVYQSLLIGLDDVKSYTLITSGGQIISTCLCLLLAPAFGIKGVAFAFLIGNSISFSVSLIRLIVKYDFVVPATVNLLLGYSLIILILTGIVSNQLAEWDISIILGKISFSLLFGSSLFLFLNKEEKRYLNILRSKVFKETKSKT